MKIPERSDGRRTQQRGYLLRCALAATSTLILLLNNVPARGAEPAHLLKDFSRSNLLIRPSNGPCVFLDIYVATDRQTHAQGLMFIEKLGEFEGMLFVYDQPAYISMWMKNTLISLDMLFIQSDLSIASIATDSVPLSTDIIESGAAVSLVLEINAGSAKHWGIVAGDRVLLSRQD